MENAPNQTKEEEIGSLPEKESRLFICNSILFSRFWIIFTIIILNLFQVDSLSPPLLFGLVGTLPAEYFSAFSSSLDCCVWGGLSVCW